MDSDISKFRKRQTFSIAHTGDTTVRLNLYYVSARAPCRASKVAFLKFEMNLVAGDASLHECLWAWLTLKLVGRISLADNIRYI